MRKFIIICLVLTCLTINCSCSNNTDYVRLRIIANSNNEYDLIEKKTIKCAINYLFDNKKLNYQTLNIDVIDKLLKETIDKSLYDKLEISYCISYYPAKAYKGKFIKSGNYETFLIKINEGKGNNFWTLLYPEYFGIEFEESNEIEFRSYFYDKLS